MSEVRIIRSTSNPKVKEIRALLRGRKATRHLDGDQNQVLLAAEGTQLLTRALGSPLTQVEYVVASQDFAAATPRDLSESLARQAVPVYVVRGELFERISRRQMKTGVAFAATHQSQRLGAIEAGQPVLVLDRVSNPRNVGAIARTAEAASFGGLILCGSHADPFSYESIRASMGSVFGLPIVSADNREMLNWVVKTERSLIGTSGAAQHSLWDSGLPRGCAVLFGNEGEGLSESLLDRCTDLVKIPYNDTVDSLNLGAAVAVVAFDYRRVHPS